MLDKFLFGNKQIPEMYFGNIPVAQIYFGTTLIWEKEGYVPYDNTCSIVITGDDTTQKFTVQVLKNGEDVTSSLEKFNGWAYIVNDVLPAYRLFVHNIPYSTVITDPTEISITDLINGYKTAESITDSRYDDTKGEYHIDANQITSKASGSFPSSGTIACQNNIVVPYTLTEDTSTSNLWTVVQPNVSVVTIKTIRYATTNYIDYGFTQICVLEDTGVMIYKYDSPYYQPSISTKTIDGVNYYYITLDLTELPSGGSEQGTFKLKRFKKYFIRITHASGGHYYYRNGGILGIVGYVTSNINVPNTVVDTSSLTNDGDKADTDAMLSVSTVNHYAKYAGSSGVFSANNVYKCKLAFTYTGTTDDDTELLKMNDGEVGYYIGNSGSMSLSTYPYVKSGISISVTTTDTPSTIYTESDSGKIFKYTGNTTANIFVKDRFYSCSSSTTVKAEITAPPSVDSVNVDDIYLATSDIYYSNFSSGWNGTGFYKVVSKTETEYTVTKLNSTIVDETDNMKAKLTQINSNNISTYYDTLDHSSTNLAALTINTDKKYEILMGA